MIDIGFPETTFLRLHQQAPQVALPKDCLDKVAKAVGSWSNVGSELERMATSSCIGQKLFQRACDALANERVAKLIEKLIKDLPKNITRESVQEMNRKLALGAQGISASLLTRRRTVDISFRGVDVSLVVSTAQEELQLRLAAHIKACLPDNALDRLCFENALSRLEVARGGRVARVGFGAGGMGTKGRGARLWPPCPPPSSLRRIGFSALGFSVVGPAGGSPMGLILG